MQDSEEALTFELIDLLKESISKLPKQDIALAFSGGIDSTILARLMQQEGINFTCYTAGVKGCHDFQSAAKASKDLGLRLIKIKIDEKDAKEAIPVQRAILEKIEKPDALSIAFNLPLFFVSKYCSQSTIVIGQGPDEMFGGYSKYLNNKNAERDMRKDLTKLVNKVCNQNVKTSGYFNKKIFFPYLDKDIINFSRKIPLKFKINNSIRKYILRKTSMNLGISRNLSYTEKKAGHYGSGLIKLIGKISKQSKLPVYKYLRNI